MSISDTAARQSHSFTRMIDLSVGIIPDAPHEPLKPKVEYLTHEGGGLDFIKNTFGVTEENLVWSGGKGAAFEEVTTITHAGTHVDAPWHYGPESEGKPARKIDELPIEWFFSDGVVLDIRHKKPNEKISVEDLEDALRGIDYPIRMIFGRRDEFRENSADV